MTEFMKNEDERTLIFDIKKVLAKLTGTKKQLFGRVKKIMKKKGANYLNEKLRLSDK